MFNIQQLFQGPTDDTVPQTGGGTLRDFLRINEQLLSRHAEEILGKSLQGESSEIILPSET